MLIVGVNAAIEERLSFLSLTIVNDCLVETLISRNTKVLNGVVRPISSDLFSNNIRIFFLR